MAYTVKKVSAMSGVSTRTLRFYDETGLLKPAFLGANGYRFYEEPQLLALQQILFYRELGFDLKRIRRIVGRADFEQLAALESHREVLNQNLVRTSTLLQTIDKTIEHLKGVTPMQSDDMFTGFSVAAGQARFDEHVEIGGEPGDCKVSSRDTNGAMCVFELTATNSGPRHLHHEQDEIVYVIDGEFEFEVAGKRFDGRCGDTIFLPRNVPHSWAAVDKPGRILNTYQPAGRMEEFFREVGRFSSPPIHEVLGVKGLLQLFQTHGMEMVQQLVPGWAVDDEGRITRTGA